MTTESATPKKIDLVQYIGMLFRSDNCARRICTRGILIFYNQQFGIDA